MAVSARVRFLSCVAPNVSLQICLAVTSVLTVRTRKWLFPSVSVAMRLEMAGVSGDVVTLRAPSDLRGRS